MRKLSIELINDTINISTWQGQLTLTQQEAKKLIADIKKILPAKKKYGYERVIINGIPFHSKMEAEFYEHLCQKFGKENVILQPKFTLQDKSEKDGKLIRAITYVADFEINGSNVVYDVKGMITTDFSIKRKLFEQKYPELSLQLITKCPKKYQLIYGEWIGLDDLHRERKISKKAAK